MTETNGNALLPQDRQAAVALGLTQYQTVAAERDAAVKDVAALKTDLAGFKAMYEAQTAQLVALESRVESAMLTRDQAVAERAKYETLFIAVQAQLRAFAIPAAPLIKDASDADPTVGTK
jgi:septal ring factor EnvC (AmiA/AmiB activator)